MNGLPNRATVREVGLRDGLQSIATVLPTERKFLKLEKSNLG